MCKRITWLAVLLLLASSSAAVDLSSAYSEKELREWQPKYATTTEQLLKSLMGEMPGQPPVFTEAERRQFAGVRLRFPLPAEQAGVEAAYHGDPLAFYSRVKPPEVVLPVLSLKFFADLTLAYTWLRMNGYEAASPTIYMKLVKYNRPGRFPGNHYPPLLAAIGVPDHAQARKNHDVEDEYYFMFNAVRTFLLLHELGHIYHRHDTSGRDRQAQEAEADEFALNVLQRLPLLPVGAALYFIAAANLQLNRADFKSDGDWETYVSGLTHPANERRLQRASDYIKANAASFAGPDATPQQKEAVRVVAHELAGLAQLAGDRELPMVPPRGAKVDLSPLVLRKNAARPTGDVKH